MVIVAIEQLSVEPLSMSSTVIEISLPNSSNCNVNGATVNGVGGVMSSTVILNEQEPIFPDESDISKVFVVVPAGNSLPLVNPSV